jgi:glyoxylase-like metal-dependent hydrolase (beta-lactamase superfamily II)
LSVDWFHVSEIEPGVHLVAEPGHVCSWLVHGSERSALVDTGLGLVSISAAIAPVARTPIVVVNSHSDFDHVGGNAEFGERLIHEEGKALLAAGTPCETLQAYDRAVRGIRESWEALAAADRDGFHLIGPDEVVRPWPPAGVDLGAWRIQAPPPTGLLQDGDELELGNRTLRVIHTPGHTPDHICLIDERAGILFAQDQAYYGEHLVYESHSDVKAWARSARRLADEVASEIRVVYVAHCLRPALPPRVLRELADGGECVAAGSVALEPGRGLFGEPVLAADFGHFSILVHGLDAHGRLQSAS